MMAADIIPKVEIDDHQSEPSKITKDIELSSMSNQALLEKMRDEMLKRISNNLISNTRLVKIYRYKTFWSYIGLINGDL